MDSFKTTFPTGYIVLACEGENIEEVFNLCLKSNIKLWHVKQIKKDTYKVTIEKKHFHTFEEICENNNIQLKVLKERGLPFLFKILFTKKEILISTVISIILLFTLSNIIWSVNIEGLPEELEHKVAERLETYGVKRGAFIFNTPEPSIIQQQLINEISELLWIGVEISGTSFVLKGVEKIIVEEGEELAPRDLIASKNAIIKDMYVKRGLAIVKRNDYVKKDALLITGVLQENEESNHPILVPAEGEVIGETWYEVTVTVPLEGNYERLTGKRHDKTYLQLYSYEIPIPSFKKEEFKDFVVIDQIYPIKFLLWNTPLNIKKRMIYEKIKQNFILSKEQALEKGKETAIQTLKRKIGEDITVITNKVLQETEENGKVNLILFVSLEENIVKSKPIYQGD